MRSVVLMLTLAALAAAAPPALDRARAAEVPAGPPALAKKQIKPGLHMITGAGGNVLVRVTPAGLIVVDTKNPGQPIFDALMVQIRTISNLPVRYVIDTHYHNDHAGNNQRFLDAGAQVVAHQNVRTNLLNFFPPAPATRPGLPTITYAKQHVVELGGVRVELHHHDRAHSGGDSIVYFPDLKTVAMGDMFNSGGGAPLIDYPFGASLIGLINMVDGALRLDFDTAVPGHGDALQTRADLQRYGERLRIALARGREVLLQGTPKTEFLAAITARLTDIGWNFNGAVMQRQTHLDGFYAEMHSAD